MKIKKSLEKKQLEKKERGISKLMSTGSQDDSGFNQYQLDLFQKEEEIKMDREMGIDPRKEPVSINIETMPTQNSHRQGLRFDSPRAGNEIGILLNNQSQDMDKPRHGSAEEIIKKSGVVVSQSTAVISGKFFDKRSKYEATRDQPRFRSKQHLKDILKSESKFE